MTFIPVNKVRKTSRNRIDLAWQIGNRQIDKAADAAERLSAPAFPERRAEIARKIERVAAQRLQIRATDTRQR